MNGGWSLVTRGGGKSAIFYSPIGTRRLLQEKNDDKTVLTAELTRIYQNLSGSRAKTYSLRSDHFSRENGLLEGERDENLAITM